MGRSILVTVVGDARQYERTLQKASAATRGFEISLKSLAKAAGLAFGFHEVIRGFEDVISKAQQSEVSMAKLNAAFKSSGVSMKQFADQVDKAQASGRRLGFTNIDTQAGLAKLVVATQSGTLALKDLQTAEDLARFKHIDLAAASQMLSQAMTGSARAVKQLGINVVPVQTNLLALKAAHKAAGTAATEQEIAAAKLADKQATGAKIIEIVTQRLHGQAEAYSTTTAGAMARFRAALEDMEEKLGQRLLPVMTKWANYLTDHMPQISAFVQDVADKIGALWRAVDKIVGVMGGWKSVLEAIVAIKLASWLIGLQNPLTKLIGGGGAGGTGLLGATGAARGLRGQLGMLMKLGAAGISIPILLNIVTKIAGGASAGSTLLHNGLYPFVPAGYIYDAARGIFTGNKTMSPAQAKQQFIKEAMANGMTRAEAEKAWRDRSGHGAGSSVNAGGKAGARRGYGGAGPIGSGIEPSPSHPSTHQTRGLSGYPAFDYMAKPGTPVLAPEDGYIVGHSGHNPAGGANGDIFGWSLYFYGTDTHSMYFMTHLAATAGDGFYKKGAIIGYVANWGARSHVHVGVNKGSGRLAVPDRSPGGTGSLAGTRGYTGPVGANLAGAVGLDPFGGGGVPPSTTSRGGGKRGRKAAPAPPMFGKLADKRISSSIADTVVGATKGVNDALDTMAQAIKARAAAIRQAILQAKQGVASAFSDFSSGVLGAFDAINAQWQSPSAKKLSAMQAEDALKASQQAYADAVAQYGADSPEAKAAARALEEAQLSAQAQAEQEAHDKKVKADKDALEKRLAELEKQAAGAKTRAQAKRIQEQINKLLAEYGITPETVQGAMDWNAAQTLFVSSMGSLKESLDALTAALGGKVPGKSSAPPGYQNPGSGSTAGNAGRAPGGRGGRFPPEFASGGEVPIIAHTGEYIIRSAAARRLGRNALAYMNATGQLPRFATGGLVGTDGTQLLGDAEYAAYLRDHRGKLPSARRYQRDARGIMKLHDLLAKRYGDQLHFEDGWFQAVGAMGYHGIPDVMATPPNSISDRTRGSIWFDFPGGAWPTPKLGHSLAGGGNGGGGGGFPGLGGGGGGSAANPPYYERIPSFAIGGVMRRTGLAYLHRGETVTPAGSNIHVTVELDGAVVGRAVTNYQGRRARYGGPAPGGIR